MLKSQDRNKLSDELNKSSESDEDVRTNLELSLIAYGAKIKESFGEHSHHVDIKFEDGRVYQLQLPDALTYIQRVPGRDGFVYNMFLLGVDSTVAVGKTPRLSSIYLSHRDEVKEFWLDLFIHYL